MAVRLRNTVKGIDTEMLVVLLKMGLRDQSLDLQLRRKDTIPTCRPQPRHR